MCLPLHYRNAEISLVDHRPSIIAAAAVLAAYDSRLTRKAIDLNVDFISFWGTLENVSIHFLIKKSTHMYMYILMSIFILDDAGTHILEL